MPNPRRYRVQTTGTDGRVSWQNPPQQRISKSRVHLIKTVAVVAAIALTCYDAYVSYRGFQSLNLPEHAPLVLAALIFIVQLASGSIQQMGMNPFRGVGGSDLMDFIWRWVLVSIYAIDVGSNAISFGISQHTNAGAIVTRPLDALGMSLILLAFALLLTFGDEILLRLVDRLVIGSRPNEASAQMAEINSKAYRRYLKQYEQRALNQADRAGQSATVDFNWLQQGGTDV